MSTNYTPESDTYHSTSLDLKSSVTQTEKFVALIERFGRWPAYLTGDPIDSRGKELVIPIMVFGSMALISTLARLFVRGFKVKSLWWDDWTMLLALASTLSFDGIYTWAVVGGGLGRFEIDVPLEMWPALFKATFVNPIIYHICCASLKASICLFLLRIATVKIYRQILWGTLIFSTLSMLGFMVVTACQCDYLDLFYGRKTTPWCFSPRIIEKCSYGSAAVNIATDFLVVLLPIPMLWKVSISTRKKVLIRLVLSLGLFASFACVIRLIYVAAYPPYGDFTRRIDFEIWSVVELNVGIFAGNIPALAPLIKGFLERRKQTPEASPVNSDGLYKPKWGIIQLPNKAFKPIKSLRNFQVSLFSSSATTKGGSKDGFDGSQGSGTWVWGSGSSSDGSTAGFVRHEKRGSDLTSLTTVDDMEKGWIGSNRYPKFNGPAFGNYYNNNNTMTSNADSIGSIYDKYQYRNSRNTEAASGGVAPDVLTSTSSSNRTVVPISWPRRSMSGSNRMRNNSIAKSEAETVVIRKTTSVSVVDEEVPPGTAVSTNGAATPDSFNEIGRDGDRRSSIHIRRV